MYWLRWHYHVKDIAGAPYKIKQKKTEVPTVRQQLYCAVQSQSPNHHRTATKSALIFAQSKHTYVTEKTGLFCFDTVSSVTDKTF